jgi:hypothetical protein
MVKWIIDKSMRDGYTRASLMEVINDCGYEVKLMEYKSSLRKEDLVYPYDIDDCVIPYTTINLGKHLKGYFGSYLDEEELRFHNYYSKLKIHPDKWVNGNFVITTFFDFESNFDKFVKLFGTDQLFIRPNSGSKLFTGLPICGYEYLLSEANALRQLSGVIDNSLIIVSTVKEIKEEYRFVIAGNDVLTGSQYQLNGKHDEQGFYTSEAFNLANEVANAGEKPVGVFTCDIAKMSDGSVKIVEINSFNCAGLYYCDPWKTITGVSEYVEKQYEELNNY